MALSFKHFVLPITAGFRGRTTGASIHSALPCESYQGGNIIQPSDSTALALLNREEPLGFPLSAEPSAPPTNKIR
jgi:hypothetical protein